MTSTIEGDKPEPALVPEGELGLRRALGPGHLIALGIGAIIGAGIFVITGHAAANYAGPGVAISFAIAGLGCLFAGLCYAEYASMIPVAGSAYTYTYATLGRFLAWIIGWNLVLEYLAASATVAVGWSGYFNDFTASLGLSLPAVLTGSPITIGADHVVALTGMWFNLPAIALIALVTLFLVIGVHVSARFNAGMVVIKLVIVLMVIGIGAPYVVEANHQPFIPPNNGTFGEFGWTGVFRAMGVIFFAYIGFDAVSVAAQEAKNPQRDVPIGILGSLILCTGLYVLMSWVVTGLAPYSTLDVAHPVSRAVELASPDIAWLVPVINIGAIVGLASVVLVLLLGQSRIFYAMSSDGMIPPIFRQIHPRFLTPWRGTIVTGIIAALMAAVLPLHVLGELVSIGTLAAFVIVCVGVMVLRVRAPRAARPFRVPGIFLVAPLGILMCSFMMVFLPLDTWLRLVIWTAIGLAIYFGYSIRHTNPSRWAGFLRDKG